MAADCRRLAADGSSLSQRLRSARKKGARNPPRIIFTTAGGAMEIRYTVFPIANPPARVSGRRTKDARTGPISLSLLTSERAHYPKPPPPTPRPWGPDSLRIAASRMRRPVGRKRAPEMGYISTRPHSPVRNGVCENRLICAQRLGERRRDLISAAVNARRRGGETGPASAHL